MRVVVASALVCLAGQFAQMGYTPLAPFLLPKDMVGWCLSLQGFCSCVALPFVGPLVDRAGSRVVLQQGLILTAVAIAVTVAGSSLCCQVVGRIIGGLAGAATFNSCISFVMDHFEEPARSRYMGLVIGAGGVGGLMAAPVTSLAYDAAAGTSQRTAWAFLPACILLLAAFVAVGVAPPATKGPLCENLISAYEASDAETTKCRCMADACSFLVVYAKIGRQAWLLVAMLACSFGAMVAMQCAIVLWMHANGFAAKIIGLSLMPSALAQAIVSPLAGHIASTPSKRRYVLISSLATLAVGLCLAARLSHIVGEVRAMIVATTLSSIAVAVIDAPSISLMTDLASARNIGNGEAVTASEMAVTAGLGMGPYIGQLCLSNLGFGGLCYALAFAAALIALVSVPILKTET